jgi:hypothetical protein
MDSTFPKLGVGYSKFIIDHCTISLMMWGGGHDWPFETCDAFPSLDLSLLRVSK